MKFFVNRKIRRNPWGGGIHFLSGFADYVTKLGHTITNNFDLDVDAIIMMDPRPDEGFGDINQIIQFKNFLNSKGKKTKVFHRINDTDIARNTNFLVDLNIRSNAAAADHTIFISNWLFNHYKEKGFSREGFVIRNGCNHEWFYPQKLEKKDKTINVVTHHWSDNFNKGFDAYIELDKQLEKRQDICFTYVGRYYKGYEPKNTKIIEPLYGKNLGDELRKHDVYLTAAKWEACGMHHIEAASCGLPIIFHKDGGGIVEMCKDNGIEFDSVDSICDKLRFAFEQKKNLTSKVLLDELNSDTVNSRYLKFIIDNLR